MDELLEHIDDIEDFQVELEEEFSIMKGWWNI